MKKLLLGISVLSCIYVNAQTIIIDEKFEKGNEIINHKFFSKTDDLLIFRGINKKYYNYDIYNIFLYDSKATKTPFLTNVQLSLFSFSNTDKTFKAYDVSSKKNNYYVNGKVVGTGFYTDLEKPKKRFYYNNSFTDKFELGITNENKSENINLEKNDIYLETIDFTNRKSKRVKLEKVDIARLVGADLNKPDENIGFKCVLNKDDSFDVITKSISKDYSKTTLYRTTYNFLGKKVNDVAFKLELKDKFFLYSDNDAGEIGSTSKLVTSATGSGFQQNMQSTSIFIDDLSINNFITDKETGEVYVYGLYGNKAHQLNHDTNPSGYYVFKFDNKGNMIWESIHELKRENKLISPWHYLINLTKSNNDYCFSYIYDRNLNYGFVDSKSGKLSKENVITFKGGRVFGNIGFSAEYDLKEFKNKKFYITDLVVLENFPKVYDYVKSVVSKSDVDFNFHFGNKGIYVTETVEKKYEKIMLFEY